MLITEPPHFELTTLPDPACGHDGPNRPWRSDFWTGLISKLSTAGYDGVTSVEHEDSPISAKHEKLTAIWWA